jgi:hypothetical protein
MKQTLKFIAVLIMLLVVVSGCGAFDLLFRADQTGADSMIPAPSNNSLTFTGTITEIVSDCTFDGICAYVVSTENETYTVIWAPGMAPCHGQFEQSSVGDVVEIDAEETDGTTLSICNDSGYYIRRVSG